MLYLLIAGALIVAMIVAVMVKLWKGYYGEEHESMMSAEDVEQITGLLEGWGALEPVRVRKLFEGEVLWSEGALETWRWSWEAGRRGDQAYVRVVVTFVGGLGQGMVLNRGGRIPQEEEAGGPLGPKIVLVDPEVLPAHIVCKARDEERLHSFLTGTRRKTLRLLDQKVAKFYLDDRRFFAQRHDATSVDDIAELLSLTHRLVVDVLDWSTSQGTIAALETGQYQGALAELEQSTIRDTSVLEEQEAAELEDNRKGSGEALPDAPT